MPARIDGARPFLMEIDPARGAVIVPIAAAAAAGYALVVDGLGRMVLHPR